MGVALLVGLQAALFLGTVSRTKGNQPSFSVAILETANVLGAKDACKLAVSVTIGLWAYVVDCNMVESWQPMSRAV